MLYQLWFARYNCNSLDLSASKRMWLIVFVFQTRTVHSLFGTIQLFLRILYFCFRSWQSSVLAFYRKKIGEIPTNFTMNWTRRTCARHEIGVSTTRCKRSNLVWRALKYRLVSHRPKPIRTAQHYVFDRIIRCSFYVKTKVIFRPWSSKSKTVNPSAHSIRLDKHERRRKTHFVVIDFLRQTLKI